MKTLHAITITLVTFLCLFTALLGVSYVDFDNYLGLDFILRLGGGNGLHPVISVTCITIFVLTGYVFCLLYDDITADKRGDYCA